MNKLYYLILALAAACTMGQDCKDKIHEYHQCKNKTHEGKAARHQDLAAKVEACFSSNGCVAPKRGQGNNDEHHGHGNRDPASQECFKQAHAKIKALVLECIQKAVPEFQPGDKSHKKHGHHHKHGHHKFLNPKVFDEACAPNGNASAALACVQAAFAASKPSDEEQKQAFEAKCSAKSQCKAALGEACQQEMASVKKAKCDCKNQLAGNKEAIFKEIPACANVSRAGPYGKHGRHQGGRRQHDNGGPDQSPEQPTAGGDAGGNPDNGNGRRHGGGGRHRGNGNEPDQSPEQPTAGGDGAGNPGDGQPRAPSPFGRDGGHRYRHGHDSVRAKRRSRSCDEPKPDYCALGFDAWKEARKNKHKGRQHDGRGRHHNA